MSVGGHAEDYMASLIRMQIPAALIPMPAFPASAGNSLSGATAPMALVGPDLNTYSYAADNALLHIDPTGLYVTIFPGQKRKDVPNDNPVKPRPAFPPPSPVCSRQCSAEYFIGVAKCAKSCSIKLFGYNGATCERSWATWLTNCQTSCNDQ